MAMQCNIDQRGRTLRAIGGIVSLLAGLVLTLFLLLGMLTDWWWWLIAVVAIFSGGFQLFEARKGWCVLRALGFRTPV